MSTLHVRFVDNEGSMSDIWLVPERVLEYMALHGDRDVFTCVKRFINDKAKGVKVLQVIGMEVLK